MSLRSCHGSEGWMNIYWKFEHPRINPLFNIFKNKSIRYCCYGNLYCLETILVPRGHDPFGQRPILGADEKGGGGGGTRMLGNQWTKAMVIYHRSSVVWQNRRSSSDWNLFFQNSYPKAKKLLRASLRKYLILHHLSFVSKNYHNCFKKSQ